MARLIVQALEDMGLTAAKQTEIFQVCAGGRACVRVSVIKISKSCYLCAALQHFVI